MSIAQGTSKTKIGLNRRAAMLLQNNVIQRVRQDGEQLRNLAILATTTGAVPDDLAQRRHASRPRRFIQRQAGFGLQQIDELPDAKILVEILFLKLTEDTAVVVLEQITDAILRLVAKVQRQNPPSE